MSRILLACIAVVLALASVQRAQGLEVEADLDVFPTASLAQEGGGQSMQVEATRIVAQSAISHKQALGEGLTLSGTAWLDADSLPSESPLAVPATKLDMNARLLEFGLEWEALPGALILDLGKKIIHPSSGFFKTPLNMLSRPAIGDVPSSTAAAVGKWEEGWVGADLTWLAGNFSIANFFSPRLAWSQGADQVLQYISQQQSEYDDLLRLGYRIGEADLRLLALTSADSIGGADSDFHLQAGAGLDVNLGDSLTVRAEASAADSTDRLYVVDATRMTSGTESVAWAPRALLGFTWAEGGAKDLSVMAEYYYNGLGFVGSDYDRLMQYSGNSLAAAGPSVAGGRSVAGGQGVADVLDQYGSFEAARHYGFARVAGNIEDDLAAQLWVVANLQDLSCMTGAVLTYTRDAWAVSGALVDAWGGSNTEEGLSPLLWRLDLELSLFF
jgi:hypothetical protein